jgi:hypothetical protein
MQVTLFPSAPVKRLQAGRSIGQARFSSQDSPDSFRRRLPSQYPPGFQGWDDSLGKTIFDRVDAWDIQSLNHAKKTLNDDGEEESLNEDEEKAARIKSALSHRDNLVQEYGARAVKTIQDDTLKAPLISSLLHWCTSNIQQIGADAVRTLRADSLKVPFIEDLIKYRHSYEGGSFGFESTYYASLAIDTLKDDGLKAHCRELLKSSNS